MEKGLFTFVRKAENRKPALIEFHAICNDSIYPDKFNHKNPDTGAGPAVQVGAFDLENTVSLSRIASKM